MKEKYRFILDSKSLRSWWSEKYPLGSLFRKIIDLCRKKQSVWKRMKIIVSTIIKCKISICLRKEKERMYCMVKYRRRHRRLLEFQSCRRHLKDFLDTGSKYKSITLFPVPAAYLPVENIKRF